MWTFAGLTRTEWLKVIFAVGGLIVLLTLARPVLAPFLIAVILAYLLHPLVSWVADKTHLPRGAVIGLLVLVFLGVGGLEGYQLSRRLVYQAMRLQSELPALEARIDIQLAALLSPFGLSVPPLSSLVNPNAPLLGRFGSDFEGSLTQLSDLGRTLVEAVLVLAATAYLLLDGPRMVREIWRFIPQPWHEPLQPLAHDIGYTLGRYISAQGLLVLLMSTMALLFVVLPFHLRYGLLIAFGVGLLEVIPIAGPLIGITGAGLLALVQHGPTTAIGVVLVLTILRQIEDQLVIPLVVGQAVHLPPVITLLAVAVGGLRGGFLGLLLAIPIAAVIKVILDYIYPPPPESKAYQPSILEKWHLFGPKATEGKRRGEEVGAEHRA